MTVTAGGSMNDPVTTSLVITILILVGVLAYLENFR